MARKEELQLKGVMSEGYGIIPKKVMKDKDLSIESKAIYAFMASYSGSGNTSFPSVDLITDMLGITRQRFNKHRKHLEDKGYITIHRKRLPDGSLGSNVYTLEVIPTLRYPTMDKPTMDKPTMDNVTTINNTLINNTNNNNTENILSSTSTVHPYKEIIEHLNDKSNKQYKHTTNKTQTLIKARFNEGFELEDFKSVIDTKSKEWMNTEMEKFIRPETLFGTKFESYLNQQDKKQDEEYDPLADIR